MLLDAANRPRGRDDLLGRLRGGSSDGSPGGCPPVVEYSPVKKLRVADEVAALPARAEIAEWLADYAVLQAQARACG